MRAGLPSCKTWSFPVISRIVEACARLHLSLLKWRTRTSATLCAGYAVHKCVFAGLGALATHPERRFQGNVNTRLYSAESELHWQSSSSSVIYDILNPSRRSIFIRERTWLHTQLRGHSVPRTDKMWMRKYLPTSPAAVRPNTR